VLNLLWGFLQGAAVFLNSYKALWVGSGLAENDGWQQTLVAAAQISATATAASKECATSAAFLSYYTSS
jgi:hypothetical protein